MSVENAAWLRAVLVGARRSIWVVALLVFTMPTVAQTVPIPGLFNTGWVLQANGALNDEEWILDDGDPCAGDVLTFIKGTNNNGTCCTNWPDTLTVTPIL